MTIIDNLVDHSERRLHKATRVEVLAFATQFEFETCNSEEQFKKRILAKFRSYDDAERYAKWLANGHTFYYKVMIRA